MPPQQTTSPDQLRAILDPLQVDQSVKAGVWDAFHNQSTSPTDFQKTLDSTSLDKGVKAKLWDLRFGAAQSQPAQSDQPKQYQLVDASGKPAKPTSPLDSIIGSTKDVLSDAFHKVADPFIEPYKQGYRDPVSYADAFAQNMLDAGKESYKQETQKADQALVNLQQSKGILDTAEAGRQYLTHNIQRLPVYGQAVQMMTDPAERGDTKGMAGSALALLIPEKITEGVRGTYRPEVDPNYSYRKLPGVPEPDGGPLSRPTSTPPPPNVQPTSAPPSPAQHVQAAGLVDKGELVKGSGVHMMEHPDFPGLTAGLDAKDLTSPEAAKNAMARKLDEFAEKPLPNQDPAKLRAAASELRGQTPEVESAAPPPQEVPGGSQSQTPKFHAAKAAELNAKSATPEQLSQAFYTDLDRLENARRQSPSPEVAKMLDDRISDIHDNLRSLGEQPVEKFQERAPSDPQESPSEPTQPTEFPAEDFNRRMSGIEAAQRSLETAKAKGSPQATYFESLLTDLHKGVSQQMEEFLAGVPDPTKAEFELNRVRGQIGEVNDVLRQRDLVKDVRGEMAQRYHWNPAELEDMKGPNGEAVRIGETLPHEIRQAFHDAFKNRLKEVENKYPAYSIYKPGEPVELIGDLRQQYEKAGQDAWNEMQATAKGKLKEVRDLVNQRVEEMISRDPSLENSPLKNLQGKAIKDEKLLSGRDLVTEAKDLQSLIQQPATKLRYAGKALPITDEGGVVRMPGQMKDLTLEFSRQVLGRKVRQIPSLEEWNKVHLPQMSARASLLEKIVERAKASMPSGEGGYIGESGQGGHAGGGVSSVEELNRPGRFVKISRSGLPTDQGKVPDFNLRDGEAGYQVRPNGSWELKAGMESPATKLGVRNYAREVYGQRGSVSGLEIMGGASVGAGIGYKVGGLPGAAVGFVAGAVAPAAIREGLAHADLAFLDPMVRPIKDKLNITLSEEITPGQHEAGIVREKTGNLARSKEQIFDKYAKDAKAWEKRPTQEGYDFILREQHGEAQLTGKDQKLADQLQTEFAKRRDKIENLEHGSFDHWQENYFPQMWEQPNRAADFVNRTFGKRPLQGSAAFKNARMYEDIQAGLDAGLTPVTHNPVTLALLKLHELDRYIMGHEILADSKEAGLAQFVKFGQRAPEGWSKVNDSMYRVLQHSDEAGGVVIRGEYYMPQDAAKILNNYLSPGLRGNKVYDAVRKTSNVMNQAQLGISAFHLAFTSIDTSVSDAALGIEKASRGDFAGSIKPTARAFTLLGSPINTIVKGNQLLKEYLSPGRYAGMSELADAVATAGGRVAMDPLYKNSAIDSFWKAWKAKSPAAVGHALPAAFEFASKPIMEHIVPRQKLGVFAGLAEDILQRSKDQSWTKERTRLELNKAWDSVDNRLGQLVYDNLFWNKATKDLGLISTRSMGWNLGTIREVGGGALDATKQAGRLAIGEMPQMTHRMAYVMALPLVVGFTGALIHYLATGQAPQSLTDYFFPKNGKIDSQGREERLSLPSYVKDLVHYKHDPVGTVTNKINPLFGMIGEMLHNRDFYRQEIRNPDDPFVKQAGELAAYAVKQFVPFSVRNVQQISADEGGVKDQALAAMGFTPAPKFLSMTPAELRAQEKMIATLPQGARDSGAVAKTQAANQITASLRSKSGDTPELFQDFMKKGLLEPKDAEKIVSRLNEPFLTRMLDSNNIKLRDVIAVYQVANPKEKIELRPLLIKKIGDLMKMPAEQRGETVQKLREILQTPTGGN